MRTLHLNRSSLSRFRKGFCFPVFFLALLAAPAQVPAQPNFVVILTDDLSQDAMDTLLQHDYAPNIRRYLIDEGIRFRNSFVTTALCCPSRVTLLTGMYSHNHGVLSNLTPDPFKNGIAWPGWLPEDGVPGRNASTLPVWLQQAGYYTGFVGKYLNGYGKHAPGDVSDPKTFVPPGWNDWQGLIDPSTYRVYEYELNDNGVVVAYGEAEADYQTDVLRDRAGDFIDEARQRQQPFFLLLSTLAPHAEVLDLMEVLTSEDYRRGFEAAIRPAPRHEYLVDGDPGNGEMVKLPVKAAFNEPDNSDKPHCTEAPVRPGITFNTQPLCVGNRELLSETEHIPNVNFQFQSMLTSILAVDDLVGRLVEDLRANNQLENTVFIFTSDNGWMYGEHRLVGKSVPYEESIRVPLYIRMPGNTAGGRDAYQVVLNNDLAPTLADFAGAAVTPGHEFDGVSLRPILEQPETAAWHRRSFLVEHWFIPSLLKFEMASFSAIRRPSEDLDFLYVGWRANQLDAQSITHDEFYVHGVDPHQLNSINLGESVTAPMRSLVNFFRTCAGAACRFAEGF